MDDLQKREEVVMRALRSADLVPRIKSKHDKLRETFGMDVVRHLEVILLDADFSKCTTDADARNVLRTRLRTCFRVKRWKQYAYIADRMIRHMVHVLVSEGMKGLEDDAQKERGVLVV